MKLLLDTHTFLWFILDDPRLSSRARSLIEDVSNQVLLSVVSHWEIAIKASIGKLTLLEPFDQLIPRELARNGIQLLPIELAHSAGVAILPLHHRDPFDRMLIAQSLFEQIPIVGADSAFDAYAVIRLWD